MSSTCSVGKPFCWRLRCGGVCCCTVIRAETTARSHFPHSLFISPVLLGPGGRLTLQDTTSLSDRRSQQERQSSMEERRKSSSKALAHRFAIFTYDFPPLLLHKKGRIPDYLWHPKPKWDEGLLGTKRTPQPMRFAQSPQFLSGLLQGFYKYASDCSDLKSNDVGYHDWKISSLNISRISCCCVLAYLYLHLCCQMKITLGTVESQESQRVKPNSGESRRLTNIAHVWQASLISTSWSLLINQRFKFIVEFMRTLKASAESVILKEGSSLPSCKLNFTGLVNIF